MTSSERRTYQRYKTLKKARVFFDVNGMKSVLCDIRDWSEEGATIEFATDTKLANVKAIYLLHEKLMIPTDLKWQRGRKAGLYLLKPLTYFMKKKVDLRICELETAFRRKNQTSAVKWATWPDREYLRFFAAYNKASARPLLATAG